MPKLQSPSKFVGYRVVYRFVLFPKKLPGTFGFPEWRWGEMCYILRKHVWIGHKGSFRYGHMNIRWADGYEDLATVEIPHYNA